MQIGLVQLLTVLFVGLKLSAIITWPWIWVLSPLWIPIAIGLVIFVFAALAAALAALLD